MSTTSSCQPHHHRKCNSVTVRERVNLGLKRFSGANPLFFRVTMVAEVGSLFPRVRTSILKSCRQKAHRLDLHLKNCHVRSSFGRWGWQHAHETVARDRFQIKIVKKLSLWEHFRKMRPPKCARDFSESSISHKNRKKKLTCSQRPFLCGRVRRAKRARDCSESPISHKNVKNRGFQSTFGR